MSGENFPFEEDTGASQAAQRSVHRGFGRSELVDPLIQPSGRGASSSSRAESADCQRSQLTRKDLLIRQYGLLLMVMVETTSVLYINKRIYVLC